MPNLKVSLISHLGLMGDPKFGYVGKFSDALILVREDPKHSPNYLIVTIGLKTLLTSAPPLPKALMVAEKRELLTHQRWPDQLRFEIPDPDRIDPAYFLNALEEYRKALSQAQCLPDMKCSECMNRQQLDVVARNDRALLICPDCVHRLPPKSIGSGTVVMMVADRWGKSSDENGMPLEFGLKKVNKLGCLTLPFTLLGAGLIYGVAWYLCLLVLNNFERPAVKLAALVFGLLLLAPTYLPLVFHLHWTRLRTAARPVFTSWIFVLVLTLIGEAVQVMCALGLGGELPWQVVLLSPFTLPLYWQSLGLYVGVVKLLCLLIAIVTTTFLASSARFGKIGE